MKNSNAFEARVTFYVDTEEEARKLLRTYLTDDSDSKIFNWVDVTEED